MPSPENTIKWRLAFSSPSGHVMLRIISLDRSKSAQHTFVALKSAYSSNTIAWRSAVMGLYCDLIVQDGVISELSRPNLEAQSGSFEVMLKSRKLEPVLTAAWKLPDQVANGFDIFKTYERFHALPTLDDYAVSVCIIAWRLSVTKIVLGFGVGVLLGVFVGCVVGYVGNDASRGMQTAQTLIALLTILQSLALAWAQAMSL